MNDFKHQYIDSYFYYDEIPSTNLKAIEMTKSGHAQGNFLVVAAKQKRGMGRGKKEWLSPSGGLYFTLGLYGLLISSGITIFTGIILHKVISQFYQSLAEKMTIKWPNDLYLEDKKIAGILSHYQSKQNYHIIGCGLNTNNSLTNTNFPTASLSEISGKTISHEKLLTEFIDLFFGELPNFIENGLDRTYYSNYDYLYDKTISIATEYEIYSGKCKGITQDGAILLQLKNGFIQPFYAGSISIL